MFSIGSRVRVKPNADEIKGIGASFNHKMSEFLGKEYTILSGKITTNGTLWKLDGAHQNLDAPQKVNSDGYWLWVEEWLEPIEETQVKEITNNDFDDMFK